MTPHERAIELIRLAACDERAARAPQTNPAVDGATAVAPARAPTRTGPGDKTMLLSWADLARGLAVGRTTIYELISYGGLRTTKIGRAHHIPESTLEQWIVQQFDEQEGAADDTSGLPEMR